MGSNDPARMPTEPTTGGAGPSTSRRGRPGILARSTASVRNRRSTRIRCQAGRQKAGGTMPPVSPETCYRHPDRRVRPMIPRPRSATTAILAVNVAAFALGAILRVLGGRSLLEAGAMVPALVAGGEWWRLLTPMFLHVGVLHLALNSFGLYLFGNLVEQSLGTARMPPLYLVAGFCATVVSFTFGPVGVAGVGASG